MLVTGWPGEARGTPTRNSGQAADRFLLVDPADGLSQERGNAELVHLVGVDEALDTSGTRGGKRDGVDADDLNELGFLNPLERVAEEQAVSGEGKHPAGACQFELLGSTGDPAAGVHQVVVDDAVTPLHVADQVHAGQLGLRPVADAPRGLLEPLFPAARQRAVVHDQSETGIDLVADKLVAEDLGPRRSVGVGGHDHGVLEKLCGEVRDGEARHVEVVHRRLGPEEALDLRMVEVHRDDAVHASHLKHLCHVGGRDGRPHLLVLLLGLPAVAVVGDDGSDAAGGRAPEG
mmetsp:Transcript_10004/g.28305  ORF Transcript_10004/g.28305 Transcript_10004/m.28305 type:complete len:290 (+) Transcript_10004:331-1200(+)